MARWFLASLLLAADAGSRPEHQILFFAVHVFAQRNLAERRAYSGWTAKKPVLHTPSCQGGRANALEMRWPLVMPISPCWLLASAH